MNLVETAYEVQDNVEYLLSSQYLGWDYFLYHRYADGMRDEESPEGIAMRIMNEYAAEAEKHGNPYTISVLNIKRATPALNAVDNLAGELIAFLDNDVSNKERLAQVWANEDVLKYESNGDLVNDSRDMYIDLALWIRHLQESIDDEAIIERGNKLLSELNDQNRFILASRSMSGPLSTGEEIALNDATGLSIFYPSNSRNKVYKKYIEHELFSFTRHSRWAAFLKAALGEASSGEDEPKPLSHLSSSVATPRQRIFLPVIRN